MAKWTAFVKIAGGDDFYVDSEKFEVTANTRKKLNSNLIERLLNIKVIHAGSWSVTVNGKVTSSGDYALAWDLLRDKAVSEISRNETADSIEIGGNHTISIQFVDRL